MKEAVEKLMEIIWYNPKKALAVGIVGGVLIAKLFRKGIFAVLLVILAGKIFIDAEREQKELVDEE